MEATARTERSSGSNAIVDRIVTAIAVNEDCDPIDLPPLYDAVDPGALAQVARESGVDEIYITYHGYRVCIDGDGDVNVTPE